ncbi:beta-1,3-galactosyltransferase 1-like [Anthonomus grandis grandis]|uniref:beta-1,3-galactosyltransferase 1-like n=1 Tax=Anthonomus grandis grandis TaxID=2921223 RepID=UPI0021660BBD|nr:beta-1,3-galactosyltransferase 1-like [Anthonomus grandis grandis]XP_050295286.1 beta-1,3-galactosyltransferase 1-like [Anthonomus grandis grandis]XP_050295287.1 beta-1,3-galactosyltransferase 1-like [Anthonomus grandis grandis]XP_050295288.1 beta-1,3-galactosyltransferase 1-like [Anthonomus grandis grandis]
MPPRTRCWKYFLVLILVFLILSISIYSSKIINVVFDIEVESSLANLEKQILLIKQQPKIEQTPILESDDYQRLINLSNFTFISISNETCKTFLLVLISSAPKNFKRRKVIRDTWGQNDAKVKTLFMIGSVIQTEIQQSLNYENVLYKDIVQGNFQDSYDNLTYKSVMALKYVTYYCPNAKYILKADDDIFVNMPLIKNYLANDISPYGVANFIQCHLLLNSPIFRGNSSKWSIPDSFFPGESKYPPYCSGAWAIISPDVIFKLYTQSQKTAYLNIEDIFLFVLAGAKYPELNFIDTKPVSLWNNWNVSDLTTGKFDHINFLFGTFEMKEEDLRIAWEYVTKLPVKTSIFDK